MEFIYGKYKDAKAYCEKKLHSEYFEFCLPYVSDIAVFREIERFLWESRHKMTRFQNHYYGPVVIDLTEWNAKTPNEYFSAFMYFICDVCEGQKCFFITEERPERAVSERLKHFFDIEYVSLADETQKKKPKNKIGFTVEKEENDNV